MAMQETEGPQPYESEVEQALHKIDEAARAAEDCLKECDSQINDMIERRGRITTQVQHIWNLRHRIKQLIEEDKRPPNIDRLMRGF